jgi:hypothetical protein
MRGGGQFEKLDLDLLFHISTNLKMVGRAGFEPATN